MNTFERIVLIASITNCVAFAGCANLPETEDDSLGEATQPLVVQSMWRRGDFPLSVCFQSSSDAPLAERREVRDAIEDTWAATSSIVAFTGWGTCGAGGADIEIFHDSSVGRGCSTFGRNHRTNTGGCGGIMELPTRAGRGGQLPLHTIVHEFGHALGFRHTQAHPDHDVANQTCPNDEGLGSGTVAGPYDPYSVMNYCADHETELSRNDRLSVELMYPEFEILGVGNTNYGLWTKGTLDAGWQTVANSGGIQDVTVMPDGKLLGVGSTNFGLWTKSCSTCAWQSVPNSGGVRSVAVMKDGTILGVGNTNYALWTKSCLTCNWQSVPNSGGIRDVAILPNGKILGVGNTNYALWTRESLNEPWVSVPDSGGIQSVDVMPNGVILGVGNTNYGLWSRMTLNASWYTVPNSGGVRSVAYGDFN